MKPNFDAQFRDPPGPPFVYMGGTTIGCGDHPTTPKRHRWGPWRIVDYRPHGGAVGRERTCQTCGLVSDMEWLGKLSRARLDHLPPRQGEEG